MSAARKLAWLLLGAGLVLSVPSPALAARGTVSDARGDAKARWDILRVRVVNGDRMLRLRIQYRGPLRTSTGFFAGVSLDVGKPSSSPYDPDFNASVLVGSSDPDNPDQQLLYRGTTQLDCRGFAMRTRARRRLVTLTVPQRCLGDRAGRVRIAARSYQVRGPADEADYIDEYSDWIAKG